jgi:hypothetical protein
MSSQLAIKHPPSIILFWKIARTDGSPTKVATIQLPYGFPGSSRTCELDKDPDSIVRIVRRWIEEVNQHALHDAIFGAFFPCKMQSNIVRLQGKMIN